MSVVYILGAGASTGESLRMIPGRPEMPVDTPPPLVNGFFRNSLYQAIGYSGQHAEQDFSEAFRYIRDTMLIQDTIGQGAWEALDLEQVSTSLELQREFANPESDLGAYSVIARNKLIRYIWRILALCTQYKYGEHYRRLVSSLEVDDSIITFNWDLLIDQELDPADQQKPSHYSNFLSLALGKDLGGGAVFALTGNPGMFLKMHGSLNWLHCQNFRCPGNSEMEFDADTQGCLNRAMGIHFREMACERCASEMLPLLVPPLLRKPVAENTIIRSVWGLARQRLLNAEKAVIIGFSAAPTDFYAAWLLRSTLGLRENVEVFLVDPKNDPALPDHQSFTSRMASIFLRGFNSDYRYFNEIGGILARIGGCDL